MSCGFSAYLLNCLVLTLFLDYLSYLFISKNGEKQPVVGRVDLGEILTLYVTLGTTSTQKYDADILECTAYDSK